MFAKVKARPEGCSALSPDGGVGLVLQRLIPVTVSDLCAIDRSAFVTARLLR
jgi:hypothetical protein